MEVRIGIKHSAKEIIFDSAQDAAAVREKLAAAYAADDALITLGDTKQREYLIPVANIAYVELGEAAPRKAGFVS